MGDHMYDQCDIIHEQQINWFQVENSLARQTEALNEY